MKHYVGLDVAMKETAICIVDDARRIVREGSRERAGSHRRVPDRDRTDWNGLALRRGRWRLGCAMAWPRRACR